MQKPNVKLQLQLNTFRRVFPLYPRKIVQTSSAIFTPLIAVRHGYQNNRGVLNGLRHSVVHVFPHLFDIHPYGKTRLGDGLFYSQQQGALLSRIAYHHMTLGFLLEEIVSYNLKEVIL